MITYYSLFFLFIAFVSSVSLHAQDEKSLRILPYWYQEEGFDFEMERSYSLSENDREFWKLSERYLIHLKVSDSSDKGYTLAWLYKSSWKEEGQDSTLETLVLRSMKNELLVEYQCTPDGRFKKLENFSRLKKNLYDNLTKVGDEIQAMPGGRQLFPKLKSAISTEESVEVLILDDIKMYHKVYGIQIMEDSTLIHRDQVQSSHMEKGIPIVTKTRIEEYYPDDSLVTIKTETQSDSLVLKERLRTQAKIIKDAAQDLPEDEAFFPKMGISITTYYDFDLLTGWVYGLSRFYEEWYRGIRKKEHIELYQPDEDSSQ